MFNKKLTRNNEPPDFTIVDIPSGIAGTSEVEESNQGEEIVRWRRWESERGWNVTFNSTTTDGYVLDYFYRLRTDYSYDEGKTWDRGPTDSYIYPISGQKPNGTVYFHTIQGSTKRTYTMKSSGSSFRYSGSIPFASITKFVISNEQTSPL